MDPNRTRRRVAFCTLQVDLNLNQLFRTLTTHRARTALMPENGWLVWELNGAWGLGPTGENQLDGSKDETAIPNQLRHPPETE